MRNVTSKALANKTSTRTPTRATGFSALAKLREQLREQAKQAAVAKTQAEETEKIAQNDARLFRETVGPVRELPAKLPAHQTRPPGAANIAPIPRYSLQDEQAALAASLSDNIDTSSLLDTDENLSFRQPQIGTDVLRKLRKGQWTIQAQLDLHGLRTDEARQALNSFIQQCLQRGLRCVRIIHGKGLGSVNREPILKGKVLGWLRQKNEVLAFCQARPAEGGAGALVLLLKAQAMK